MIFFYGIVILSTGRKAENRKGKRRNMKTENRRKKEATMLLAKFTIKGKTTSELYFNSWGQYFSDTFSPDTKIENVIEFKVKGKTYAERKANARQIAIDFQAGEFEGLSYYELYLIQNYFEKVGKRYGLLEEFKENCIC